LLYDKAFVYVFFVNFFSASDKNLKFSRGGGGLGLHPTSIGKDNYEVLVSATCF
jgi:hypothetical protein